MSGAFSCFFFLFFEQRLDMHCPGARASRFCCPCFCGRTGEWGQGGIEDDCKSCPGIVLKIVCGCCSYSYTKVRSGRHPGSRVRTSSYCLREDHYRQQLCSLPPPPTTMPSWWEVQADQPSRVWSLLCRSPDIYMPFVNPHHCMPCSTRPHLLTNMYNHSLDR